MPVLVGQQPGGVVLPEVGFAIATWYAPDGSVWPLMARESGVFTLADGVSGLGSAALAITTDDRARGGVKVRHIQPGPRTIIWPLHIFGATHVEFINLWREVENAFTQTTELGPGQLEIARPDGTARRVDAYYDSGFDPSGTQGSYIFSDTCVISLLCEDPYWRDANPVHVHREFAAGVDFQSPYPSVSSSQVLGDTTLINAGNVAAWPTTVITGPASLFTSTRLDTGDEFVLDPNATAIAHGDLAAGEQVTVRTDPPQVRFQDGSNWTATLDWPGAVLWSIPPGRTAASFELDGASAGSAVDLTFYQRYKSA